MAFTGNGKFFILFSAHGLVFGATYFIQWYNELLLLEKNKINTFINLFHHVSNLQTSSGKDIREFRDNIPPHRF